MCMLFYWNLKWPPQINFLNICDRKKSNLIYGGGWYRTSVLKAIYHWIMFIHIYSPMEGGRFYPKPSNIW